MQEKFWKQRHMVVMIIALFIVFIIFLATFFHISFLLFLIQQSLGRENIIPIFQLRKLSKNGQITRPKFALLVQEESELEFYVNEEP